MRRPRIVLIDLVLVAGGIFLVIEGGLADRFAGPAEDIVSRRDEP